MFVLNRNGRLQCLEILSQWHGESTNEHVAGVLCGYSWNVGEAHRSAPQSSKISIESEYNTRLVQNLESSLMHANLR